MKSRLHSLSCLALLSCFLGWLPEAKCEDITITTNGGTTVVQGANPRNAGELTGQAARAAAELGLGIGDAFAGFDKGAVRMPSQVNIDGPQGPSRVVVEEKGGDGSQRQVPGTGPGGSAKIEERGKNAVVKRHEQSNDIPNVKAGARGRMLTGSYAVNVAGNDGSAQSYSDCESVEIIKDGQVYQEGRDTINFTGAVRFRTAGGESKYLSGTINVTRME